MTKLPDNSKGLNSGPPLQSCAFPAARMVINLGCAPESLVKLFLFPF